MRIAGSDWFKAVWRDRIGVRHDFLARWV